MFVKLYQISYLFEHKQLTKHLVCDIQFNKLFLRIVVMYAYIETILGDVVRLIVIIKNGNSA